MEDIYDLVVVGAGLSALSFLRSGGASGKSLVVDYQAAPGGFLRAALPSPGMETEWELIRLFQAPVGVEMRFDATAVGLLPAFSSNAPHTVLVRTRLGTEQIRAGRIVIASGGLEMTREQAQVPGSRPAGIVTPILVHQFLERGYLAGRRAVVYGGARSAANTARRMVDAGIDVTLVPPPGSEVSEDPTIRAEQPAELVEVTGFPRLERLELHRDGRSFELAADLLVYAAGMVPNTLWLKGSGIETASDGSVAVGERYETSLPNVHAIGTVVAPSLDHVQSIAMGETAAHLLGKRTG